MSKMFKTINDKQTQSNVISFFKNDLERLLLLSGSSLTDVSSPSFEGFGIHGSSPDSMQENKIIDGIDADAELRSVADALRHLSSDEERVLNDFFLRKLTWNEVANDLSYSRGTINEIRQKALIHFADAFTFWQLKNKVEDPVDLHGYFDKKAA